MQSIHSQTIAIIDECISNWNCLCIYSLYKNIAMTNCMLNEQISKTIFLLSIARINTGHHFHIAFVFHSIVFLLCVCACVVTILYWIEISTPRRLSFVWQWWVVCLTPCINTFNQIDANSMRSCRTFTKTKGTRNEWIQEA